MLTSGKLPLPLANDFKKFFIDKIVRIMKVFQICYKSEDIFTIPNFPLKTMCLLARVTIEQILSFIKNE